MIAILIITAFVWTPVLVFKFSKWTWSMRGLYELNALLLTLAFGVAWLYMRGFYKTVLILSVLLFFNDIYWNYWYLGTEQRRQRMNPIHLVECLFNK